MKSFFLILTFYLSNITFSQHILPVRLNTCEANRFCLDCGDTLAAFVESEFLKMTSEIEEQINLKKMDYEIIFQVLVDSTGHGCVLSHSIVKNRKVAKAIIEKLNSFTYWTPAYTEGKLEPKTSINVKFTFLEGRIITKILRFDVDYIIGPPE